MSAAFQITVDSNASIVRIATSGFFSLADVDDLAAAVAAAQRKLRCGRNRHLTLVDIRAMAIQAQDCVIAFGNLIAQPGTASLKLAFVTAQSLARHQIRRAASCRPAAFFDDIEQAEAWLKDRNSEPS